MAKQVFWLLSLAGTACLLLLFSACGGKNQPVYEDESLGVFKTGDGKYDVAYGRLDSGGSATIELKEDRSVAVASVAITSGHSVTLRPREGAAPLLQLLIRGDDAALMSLFDINTDGTWDARRSASSGGSAIFVDGRWVAVESLELNQPVPTAQQASEHWVFENGWEEP